MSGCTVQPEKNALVTLGPYFRQRRQLKDANLQLLKLGMVMLPIPKM